MKVLFISGAQGADYQADVVMHGLRSLLGPDLVDVKKVEFMYQGWPHPPFHSLYALLPNIEIDRENIVGKIRDRFFDAVVYGSIHRCQDYWPEVESAYPPSKVAFIDGEDDNGLRGEFFGKGSYFKRELDNDNPAMLPIQFGIPEEKIRPIDLNRKTRLMAHCDPRDRSTYVYYDSEASYYDQYSDAYFGWTQKKGGWDSMRHHEILAAGCLPYFENLDNCPPRTLWHLKRDMYHEMRMLRDTWNGESYTRRYLELANAAQQICLLTTKQIAQYVLEHCQ